MKAASATVAAMSHGLTRGFHCAIDAAFGLTTVVDPAPDGTGGSVCNSGKTFSWRGLMRFSVAGSGGLQRQYRGSKIPQACHSNIDVHGCRPGSWNVGKASQCGTWRRSGRLFHDWASPSNQRDRQRNDLHEDNKGDACGPLSEGPEGTGNDSGCRAAEIVAGDVDAGGGDPGSGWGGDAKM